MTLGSAPKHWGLHTMQAEVSDVMISFFDYGKGFVSLSTNSTT